MRIKFGLEEWESDTSIPVEDLLARLLSRFPDMVIDRAKGDAYVQAGLDRLLELRAPKVIVESHM